jgi:prevent-host-death family protein
MPNTSSIKPISYLKANAAQVLRDIADTQTPLVITQNGEAAAVLQDVHSFQKQQEAVALLKILAIGNAEIAQGKLRPVRDVFSNLPKRPARKAA